MTNDSRGEFDVYAAQFLTSRPSLDDIRYKRTKYAIKKGIDNRTEIGCGAASGGGSRRRSANLLADCDTYTRHIASIESDYSVLRDSKETKYADAVIVVETN